MYRLGKPLALGFVALMVCLVPSNVRAQDDERLIQRFYRMYLHRWPDREGMENNLYLLRTGVPPIEVEAALMGSGEYYQIHGDRPAGFITGMFQDVLRRDPSREDIDYWMDRLDQNNYNRQATALDFLQWARPKGRYRR